MAKQLGFLVDLHKCVGCRGCETACLNEHQMDELHYRRVIQISKDNRGLGFLSMACNHCMNPECIRVCKRKCFHKRRDGIVLHRSQLCTGCQSCVGACPFHSPKVHPRTMKASKCNFCVERIEKGLEPACVAACIVGALRVADVAEGLSLEAEETLPHFPIVQFTKPAVRFILPKVPRCFWRDS